MAKVEQVFGVSKDPVESYVERPDVDGLFKEAVSGDKQIIVYGASKQGKTALVERHLPYKDNIVVRCSPGAKTEDLYRSVLRLLNIEIVSERESGTHHSGEVGGGARFKALVPFLVSGQGDASLKVGGAKSSTERRETIEFNLSLAQDVSELIKRTGSSKFIVLENFHYLDEETQRTLSFDLRSFQEVGIRFVILGVWREKNRLAQFNGDLLDRMIEIPVEPWAPADFNRVMDAGERALRIELNVGIRNKLINNAFDSIGVLQELLKNLCKSEGVLETQSGLKGISDSVDISEVVKQKVADYSVRHIRALESIAEGRKSKKLTDDHVPLYLPYYLVKAFLEFDFESVIKGVSRERLEKKIKEFHHRPDDVRASDMSNLLHGFAALQNEKNISPPLFDYDKGGRVMRVVDSTFYFFLRNCSRDEVLREIPNPLESKKG